MKIARFIPLCGLGLLFTWYSHANNNNLKDQNYEEISCTMKNVYFGAKSDKIDYEYYYKRIINAKIAEKLNNYRLIFKDTGFFLQIDEPTIRFFEVFLSSMKNSKNPDNDETHVKALEGFIDDMKLLKGHQLLMHVNKGWMELFTNQDHDKAMQTSFGPINVDRSKIWSKFR